MCPGCVPTGVGETLFSLAKGVLYILRLTKTIEAMLLSDNTYLDIAGILHLEPEAKVKDGYHVFNVLFRTHSEYLPIAVPEQDVERMYIALNDQGIDPMQVYQEFMGKFTQALSGDNELTLCTNCNSHTPRMELACIICGHQREATD